MAFIVMLQETTGAKIGVTVEASTAQEAFESALSQCNEMREIISKECPGLLAEKDFLTPAASSRSTKDLLKDFDKHFERHVVNGKIVSLDKNCSFCKAYYDKLNKKHQTISS